MSDASAALLGALIGGMFGLLGVWLGFYLSRRGSEEDRRAEKLLTVYKETESLWNLIDAVQKERITHAEFFGKWAHTTENILGALISSGLDRAQILKAINGKWNDPNTVTTLRALADALLEKLDAEYARAAREMLNDLKIKPEDIGQVILRKK